MTTRMDRVSDAARFSLNKDQRGITLIEVLSAMVILALGILALAPMVVLSIQANGGADDLTQATMLAQNKLEEYKQMDTLATVPYEEITVDSSNGLTAHLRLDNNGSDGSIPTGMNRISVAVSWTDPAGVNRTIDYSTLTLQ